MFYSSYKNCKRLQKFRLFILIIFLLLIVRLASIMVVKGRDLQVLTNNQYCISEPSTDMKFRILDDNGKNVLKYKTNYYVVIDPENFLKNNIDANTTTINTLIYTLRNYNEKYDLSKLRDVYGGRRAYYKVDLSTYDKVKKIHGLNGMYCFSKKVANVGGTWNYKNMLLKKTSRNKTSIEEKIADLTAKNKFPSINYEKSISGKIVKGDISKNAENKDIKLTIDDNLENKIKKVLDNKSYSKYYQVGVAVMESSTGKIKALVQKDDGKPNILLCSTTENGYEPGSIFKTIVEEAALEKDSNLKYTKVMCREKGENHGSLDMEQAYIRSCNSYFSAVANNIGFTRIYNIARQQGLFSKVLNFSGNNEVQGDIAIPKSIDETSFANQYGANKDDFIPTESPMSMIGMGQSVRITPLQALNIVNTIVTGGIYIKPYIIDGTVNSNGDIIDKFTTQSNRVISEDTANFIMNNMREVIDSSDGTGKQAYVSGVDMGGKTGTNTRIDNYGKKKSDGWFIGYFKVNDIYYSAVVFVNNINVEDEYGGSTAAPIFRDVVKMMLNK
ncbi:penicillin-binding transpeptidase domain-containing protein [Clostridium oryzae]|uniref:Stage V sporulation protein D n=1 Tax=Clostridium oryzae TaxID=1450648 RepID=A0A1V4IUB3_9CLOT|nr:penicillin-binding transpeptidase domain-containing protein [Clostridium oryzae]OPJ63631.1 stage V sporulation protein D [Clostridium oryzae]